MIEHVCAVAAVVLLLEIRRLLLQGVEHLLVIRARSGAAPAGRIPTVPVVPGYPDHGEEARQQDLEAMMREYRAEFGSGEESGA